ncbi:hypothetical protein VPJ68_01410, partial [Parabacteroides distasonis]
IGEPGTQLTLRTFHAGGIAGGAAANASVTCKAAEAVVEFDELRAVPYVDNSEGSEVNCEMVVSRLTECRFVDPTTGITLSNVL